MRNKTEIIERFHELVTNCLRQRKEKYLSRGPDNCDFHYKLRVKGEKQLSLCQNPVILSCIKAKAFVCSEESSQTCRVFKCRNTPESVERDFAEVLRSPARCGQEYPKLAVLIWCLQDVAAQGRLARFYEALHRFWLSFWRMTTFKWW